MHWLPMLNKIVNRYSFISSPINCFITTLSIILTYTDSTNKNLVINGSNKALKQKSEISYFWSVKKSSEIVDELHSFIGNFVSVQSFHFLPCIPLYFFFI